MSIISDRRVPQPRPAGHVERAFNPDAVCTEKVGTPIKMDTVEPADDVPLPAMSGISRLEVRIEGLETMVKRIATHLGIEG